MPEEVSREEVRDHFQYSISKDKQWTHRDDNYKLIKIFNKSCNIMKSNDW